MACIRGKHTTPHTKAAKRKIAAANMGNLYRDGKISFTNELKDREPIRLENQLAKVKGTNRKHVLKFYNQCLADGLASSTIRKYLLELNTLSRMLGKDFRKATKDDLIALCGKLEQRYSNVHSKSRFKITLKKLYKIIEGDNEEYPKKVRWVKVRNGINYKLPEDILTESDVRAIVQACYDIREKSFVSMHYLTGCRSGELLNLRIRDIAFDDKGAVFRINGSKTEGSKRMIRITSGLEMLRTWLSQHPDPKPDNLVWMMDYYSSRGLFRKINRRMKIKGFTKHISAHDFRRGRATYLAGQNLNAFQLMSFFGWRKPSTALYYVALSGKQLDDSLCALPEMVF
jgi:integrase